MSGENIDSLIIALGAGANFPGRVTAAGADPTELDRIRIFLFGIDEDRSFGAGGQVKKDGTFELKSVSDGDYAILVEGLEKNWYVKSVRLGADELVDKGLQLEAGGSGGRLEVVVSSASAQLQGSVSQPRQAGHRGARAGRARTRDALQSIPIARREDRPERPFYGHRFGPRHLSPACHVHGIAGGDVLRSDPQDHHLVRARP